MARQKRCEWRNKNGVRCKHRVVDLEDDINLRRWKSILAAHGFENAIMAAASAAAPSEEEEIEPRRCRAHLKSICTRECIEINADGMVCEGECVLPGDHASITSPCACGKHAAQVARRNAQARRDAAKFERLRKQIQRLAAEIILHGHVVNIVQPGPQGVGKTSVRRTIGMALVAHALALISDDMSLTNDAVGDRATTTCYSLRRVTVAMPDGSEVPVANVFDTPGIRWSVPDGTNAAKLAEFERSRYVLAAYLAGLDDGTRILDESTHEIVLGVDTSSGAVDIPFDEDNAANVMMPTIDLAHIVRNNVVVTIDDPRPEMADTVSFLTRIMRDGTIADTKPMLVVTKIDQAVARGTSADAIRTGLRTFGFTEQNTFLIDSYTSFDDLPRASTHAEALRLVAAILCNHRANIIRVIAARQRHNRDNPDDILPLTGPFVELTADPRSVLGVYDDDE